MKNLHELISKLRDLKKPDWLKNKPIIGIPNFQDINKEIQYVSSLTFEITNKDHSKEDFCYLICLNDEFLFCQKDEIEIIGEYKKSFNPKTISTEITIISINHE